MTKPIVEKALATLAGVVVTSLLAYGYSEYQNYRRLLEEEEKRKQQEEREIHFRELLSKYDSLNKLKNQKIDFYKVHFDSTISEVKKDINYQGLETAKALQIIEDTTSIYSLDSIINELKNH